MNTSRLAPVKLACGEAQRFRAIGPLSRGTGKAEYLGGTQYG